MTPHLVVSKKLPQYRPKNANGSDIGHFRFESFTMHDCTLNVIMRNFVLCKSVAFPGKIHSCNQFETYQQNVLVHLDRSGQLGR